MRNQRLSLVLPLVLVSAVGCGAILGFPPLPAEDPPSDAGAPDAAPDTTRDAAQDAALDAGADTAPLLECDQSVLADWGTAPPALGVGTPESIAEYDSRLRHFMLAHSIAGGSVAVVKDGRLVLARSYGFADREAATLVHPTNLFRVAHLSKQITAAAVLVLTQKLGVSLDDKAFDILSDLQPLPGATKDPALAAITLRQLLQQTSGLAGDVDEEPMFHPAIVEVATGTSTPQDCNTTIRYMLGQTPTHSPGTAYNNSYFGYCVLSAVIEKVTQKPYADWVSENVLTPIGASAIVPGHTLQAQRVDDEVTYYDEPDAALVTSVFPVTQHVPAPYGAFYLEGMLASLGWVASPLALARLQSALDGRLAGGTALLSNGNVAATTQNPHVPYATSGGGTTPNNGDNWFGLGWWVKNADNAGDTNWFDRGSLPGTLALQVTTPKRFGFGWVALFNGWQNGIDIVSELDGPLWDALGGTADAGDAWATDDLFDQYAPPMTAWLPPKDYEDAQDKAALDHLYPTQLEGRLSNGAPLFRARFAPQHTGTTKIVHGIDCLEYKQRRSEALSLGMTSVALQSFVGPSGARLYQAVWVK